MLRRYKHAAVRGNPARQRGCPFLAAFAFFERRGCRDGFGMLL